MARARKQDQDAPEIDAAQCDAPEIDVQPEHDAVCALAPPDEVQPEPAPKSQQIVRHIQTVLIEVPLCVNPPDRPGSSPHIALHLTKSRSPLARKVVQQLLEGLRQTEARTASGKPVRTRNDVCVWLLDQLGLEMEKIDEG